MRITCRALGGGWRQGFTHVPTSTCAAVGALGTGTLRLAWRSAGRWTTTLSSTTPAVMPATPTTASGTQQRGVCLAGQSSQLHSAPCHHCRAHCLCTLRPCRISDPGPCPASPAPPPQPLVGSDAAAVVQLAPTPAGAPASTASAGASSTAAIAGGAAGAACAGAQVGGASTVWRQACCRCCA